MKVVVLGASGNVGTSALAALGLAPEVESIIGVARRCPEAHFQKVSWVRADISRSDLVPIFRGADCVVHLAWLLQPARDEELLWRVNVDGSSRVMEAVRAAQVPALVYVSSVGAYAPGPRNQRLNETWPVTGFQGNYYSRQKAAVEALLDTFEASGTGTRVVRLRPAFIFKREAGSEIRRLFMGRFFPRVLLRPGLLPRLPYPTDFRFQVVHSRDVGDAVRLATLQRVHGPFNLATEPELGADEVAAVLGTRPLRLPAFLTKLTVDLAWFLRLIPIPGSWQELGQKVPLMDTTRARVELGWQPLHSATETLRELLSGIREGSGLETPPLVPAEHPST